jgi:outer membrane lipoprotein-sorting protein
VARSLPLARPAAGRLLRRIPFVASQATQVPFRRDEGNRISGIIRLAVSLIVTALVTSSVDARAFDTNAFLTGWFTAQTNLHTLSADFVQTRNLKSLTVPLTARGHLSFAAPDAFRWELGQPARTIALGQNEEMYVIYPLLKRAEHYSLGAKAPKDWRDAMALLQAGFPRGRAAFESQFLILSMVETNGICQMALQPRSSFARQMMPELRLELTPGDYILRVTELRMVDGSTLRNDFTNVVLNPNFESNVFNWKPPADYKVTEPFAK